MPLSNSIVALFNIVSGGLEILQINFFWLLLSVQRLSDLFPLKFRSIANLRLFREILENLVIFSSFSLLLMFSMFVLYSKCREAPLRLCVKNCLS